MKEIRTKVRAVILAITGLLAVFLVLRIALDLMNASDKNILVDFINSVSNIFIGPFEGIVKVPESSGFKDLNVDAVVALAFVIFGGIMVSELITTFLHDAVSLIIRNLVDLLFKLAEGLIFIRLTLDLFKSQDNNKFTEEIVSLTNWTRGITNITFLEDRIYLSTFIVLIIIVIFDFTSDIFLTSIFKHVFTGEKKLKKLKPSKPQTTIAPVPPTSLQPIHQTINVHVPTPAPVQNNIVPVPVAVNPFGQPTKVISSSPSTGQPPRQVIKVQEKS